MNPAEAVCINAIWAVALLLGGGIVVHIVRVANGWKK